MQRLPKNKQSKKEDKPWRGKWSCSPRRNSSSSSRPWNRGCCQYPESCIFLADDISTISSVCLVCCWCIRSSSQSTARCLPPQSPYPSSNTLQLVSAPSVLYEPRAPSGITSAYPLALLWGLRNVSHQPSS